MICLRYIFSITTSSNNHCKQRRNLDASPLLYESACSFFHCNNTTKLNLNSSLTYLNDTVSVCFSIVSPEEEVLRDRILKHAMKSNIRRFHFSTA